MNRLTRRGPREPQPAGEGQLVLEAITGRESASVDGVLVACATW
jgi:hypothetical protein